MRRSWSNNAAPSTFEKASLAGEYHEFFDVNYKNCTQHWFKVLSATARPEEYAEQVTAAIRKRCWYHQERVLSPARRIATPAQRKTLAEAPAGRS